MSLNPYQPPPADGETKDSKEPDWFAPAMILAATIASFLTVAAGYVEQNQVAQERFNAHQAVLFALGGCVSIVIWFCIAALVVMAMKLRWWSLKASVLLLLIMPIVCFNCVALAECLSVLWTSLPIVIFGKY